MVQKSTYVDLIHGLNTIEMQMYWGWMYVDYLATPSILSTGVENTSSLPTNFSLEQNYPNPFNPSTTINFNVAKASNVKLTVYNVLGQKVATLVDERMNAGTYNVKFDARKLASGIYFYRLEAGAFTSNKKMMLIK